MTAPAGINALCSAVSMENILNVCNSRHKTKCQSLKQTCMLWDMSPGPQCILSNLNAEDTGKCRFISMESEKIRNDLVIILLGKPADNNGSNRAPLDAVDTEEKLPVSTQLLLHMMSQTGIVIQVILLYHRKRPHEKAIYQG